MTKICQVDGCDEPVRSLELCRQHYMSWYRHGEIRPRSRGRTLLESFSSKYEVVGDCWIWTGNKYVSGYGAMQKDKKQLLAHRVSYELFKGEIGEGMHVCHTCDTPACVNPDHLFLGTAKDNMTDCAEKGRSVRGERQPGAKLTEDRVRYIRSSGLSDAELARRLGVARPTVREARVGITWRHVV